MPTETDTTKLEARIVELENALKALTALREPVDLSADEIKAYLKVRDAIEGDKRCGSWAAVCVANCASGNEPCVANCASGNEPCVANCGSWPTRCVCGAFSRCGPCSRCGCDIGYFGRGGLARFGDLGS